MKVAVLDFASKFLDEGKNVKFFEDQAIDLPNKLLHKLNRTIKFSSNEIDADAIILSKRIRWMDDEDLIKKILISKALIFDPVGLMLKKLQASMSSSHYFAEAFSHAK